MCTGLRINFYFRNTVSSLGDYWKCNIWYGNEHKRFCDVKKTNLNPTADVNSDKKRIAKMMVSKSQYAVQAFSNQILHNMSKNLGI